jgi:DNA mismatch repair ATPase MutS
LTAFSLGAAIRTVDSIMEGHSRFYAEIKRLRQIVDLTAQPLPVLFLLDELLSGTNSHDRRLGAEGILRELLRRNAFGLVTTHDLALTEIAHGLEGAGNIHLDDRFEDGEIRFDYKLRPGVVARSNALELMRSVGLPVA